MSPLLFVGPLQNGLQATGIELGWAGSISARWTDAQGSRSTARALRQSDGPAGPRTTPPHPLHPHSLGNRGGEECWALGLGVGRRHSWFWAAALIVGARIAQG